MPQKAIPFVPLCPECQSSLPYKGAVHLDQQQCSLREGEVPHDPVEWTVYSQYAPYPTLFGRSPWSRWFIFNHLFFTIGTGYEWFNGQLRDVTERDVVVGDTVQWRTFEDEEAELLGKMPSFQGPDAAKKYQFLEESRQYARAELHKDWAEFEKQPSRWYRLCEYSPIFELPETTSGPWLAAACDATQMFLHGEADGQSLQQVYSLIELRAHLFARIGLPAPSLDDTRMTSALLSAKEKGACIV